MKNPKSVSTTKKNLKTAVKGKAASKGRPTVPAKPKMSLVQLPQLLKIGARLHFFEELRKAFPIQLEELSQEFGSPFYPRLGKKGIPVGIKAINQSFFAALWSKENIGLHEPSEGFFRYDFETGLWVDTTENLIKTEVSDSILSLDRAFDEFRTDATHNSIIGHLRGLIEVKNAFRRRRNAVHLKNCMLEVTQGGQKPMDFGPNFYSRNQSPIAYDPTATCRRFLTELIGPAVLPEDQILLQKYAGQCLLGENIAQRLLLVDGNPGTGKTQFALILQSIVGQVNCGQLRTKHLTDRFEVGRMLKKTLLVGVDVDAKFLSCDGAPVLKSLVGGDMLEAELKNSNGVFPVEGRFNCIMTANSRLRVRIENDLGAWKRRIMIVRYEGPKPTKRVLNFADVLVKEEGAGILNWALEGLRMLLKDIEDTGDFVLTDRQANMVDSLLAESQSIRHFISARVQVAPHSELTTQDLAAAYVDYCKGMGWAAEPVSIFEKALPDLMMDIHSKAKSHDCGIGSQRGYRGVKLAPAVVTGVPVLSNSDKIKSLQSYIKLAAHVAVNRALGGGAVELENLVTVLIEEMTWDRHFAESFLDDMIFEGHLTYNLTGQVEIDIPCF